MTLSIAGQDWPAIIDTGFNGDLELPEELRASLNARYVGRVASALAGGQRIEEDVYVVEFPFDGHTLHAEATFVCWHPPSHWYSSATALPVGHRLR